MQSGRSAAAADDISADRRRTEGQQDGRRPTRAILR